MVSNEKKKINIEKSKAEKTIKKQSASQRTKIKELDPVKRIKIRVVGIGGGGGSIVADISSTLKGARFLAANTDRSSFSKLKRRIETFQFGEELTKGFGTGMNMELGYSSALNSRERITNALQGYDLCVLIACLGGGTGSGASPVFAGISKKLGNLTYGIFTLPFNFEGKKKLDIAKESLKRSIPFFNAITIVPNERIFQIVDRKAPLRQALLMINKSMAFNLEGLLDMIYNAGIINIDFADIKTILTGKQSLTYLNRVQVNGEGRAKKAMQEVLNNPLYPYSISGARRILFNISGPSNLSLSEVSRISKGISAVAQKESKIIFGVSQKTEKQKLEISLLAIGCEMKNFFPRDKKIIKFKKQEKIEEKNISDKTEDQQDKNSLKDKNKSSEEKKEANQEEKQVEKKQVEEKPEKIKKEKVEKVKVRKNALQIQKDVQVLEQELQKEEEIWDTPAFMRKNS